MARTPTDPTKAQVWVTKGLDDLDFEFYIPQGPKGEPGGITLPTVLGSTNLNTIVTSGVYRQDNGVTPTLALNYPTLAAGILTVYERLRDNTYQSVIQEYQPVNSVTGVPMIYRRYYFGNATWTPWRMYASSRIDQTAGRAVYVWDDVNGREQLIHGDTGSRIVSDLVDATKWTGYTLKLRRIGYMIELRILGLQLASGITGTQTVIPTSLPSGFQNQHSFGFSAIGNDGSVTGGNLSFGGGPMVLQNPVAGRSYSALLTWQTANPWPTTLPGTVDGSIQNL